MIELDKYGRVSCDGCDASGRPEGGVSYERVLQRITMRFNLPSGWAFKGCGLWCPTCALRYKSKAVPRERDNALADAVTDRQLGNIVPDESRYERPPPTVREQKRAARAAAHITAEAGAHSVPVKFSGVEP